MSAVTKYIILFVGLINFAPSGLTSKIKITKKQFGSLRTFLYISKSQVVQSFHGPWLALSISGETDIRVALGSGYNWPEGLRSTVEAQVSRVAAESAGPKRRGFPETGRVFCMNSASVCKADTLCNM